MKRIALSAIFLAIALFAGSGKGRSETDANDDVSRSGKSMKPDATYSLALRSMTEIHGVSSEPQLLEQAMHFFRSDELDSAESAFRTLTELNPYEGGYWYFLGRTLAGKGDFEKAIEANTVAGQLHFDPKYNWTILGLSYKGLQDREAAAEWIGKAVALDPSWIDIVLDWDPELRAFLGDEFADEIFGKLPDDTLTRDRRWMVDLEFMKRVVIRSHYDPFVRTPKETWDKHYYELVADVPGLSDTEIALRISKFMALAGDGHTNLWFPPDTMLDLKRLPLGMYLFDDGLFIRASDSEYRDLVGSKVIEIGELPVVEAITRASLYWGHDNPMHINLMIPHLLSAADILKQIGATEESDQIRFLLQRGDGQQFETDVTSRPWASVEMSGRFNMLGWASMNDSAEAELPLWLQKPGNIYWYEYQSETELLYFHYAAVSNKNDQSFADFVDEMFAFIDANAVRHFVIDIRTNDGGSTDIYRPLMQKLLQHPELNQQGRLFVIIGRHTYSAAVNVMVDLEYWTNALFVGEPASAPANFIGENKMFRLPNSGLQLSVSDRYHQRGGSDSTDHSLWIAPDIRTVLNSDDFAANRDPAMEVIVRYISR